MVKKFGLNQHIFMSSFQLKEHLHKTSTFLSDFCTGKASPCTNQEEFSKFRTISGRCNNLESNLWGSTDIPVRRILSPCKRDFFNTRSTLLTSEDFPSSTSDSELQSSSQQTGKLIHTERYK
jgi:hypothetical protein